VRPRALALGGDYATAAFGVGLTALLTLATAKMGPALPVGGMLGLLVFGVLVWAFVAVPHIAVAALVPLFALLPSIKIFLLPSAGPLKDVAALAAVVASTLLIVQRRRDKDAPQPDTLLALSVVALLVLYIVNLGGGLQREAFGAAWLHGVRLTAEPLLLLIVGLSVREPRKVFRWAMWSLIGTSVFVALYGLFQQVLGPARLVELGYEWDVHIRVIADRLRSFGTMDDPFLYAAFLCLGLSAALLWMRRGPAAFVVSVISAGIAVAFVRTSALIVIALLGVWLAKHKQPGPAAFLLAGAVLGSIAIFLSTEQATQTRTVQSGSLYLTLNGRTDAWAVALGTPVDWPFGQGVGKVGTAAERATFTFSRSAADARDAKVEAVDSGYFATIADVGFVGLAVMLVLLGRLFVLARGAARVDSPAGQMALAFLIVLVLDAMTRASFTGFPTAFIGFLLVGVALAAAGAERAEAEAAPVPAP
jgi:uncharacterized membrane protein YozB (DUF420 family)